MINQDKIYKEAGIETTTEKIAFQKGWRQGFKEYRQILCPHPVESIESEFNENEQFSYCTLCEKDLNQNILNKLPEYVDDQEGMVF